MLSEMSYTNSKVSHESQKLRTMSLPKHDKMTLTQRVPPKKREGGGGRASNRWYLEK